SGSGSKEGMPSEGSEKGEPGGQMGEGGQKPGKPGEGGEQPGGAGEKPGQEGGMPGEQGGKPDGEGGKAGGEGGKPGESGGESGKPGGESGKPGGESGKPGGEGGKPGQPGQSTGQDGGKGGPPSGPPKGSGANSGGGGNAGGTLGEGGGEGDAPPQVTPDETDLANKRRATDLALQRLKEKLERGETPEKLMEKLDFTEEDLQNFMHRLEERLADEGADQSPEAQSARRQFESLLRGTDYESRGGRKDGGNGPREASQSFGSSNRPVPPEYQRDAEAYKKRLSRETSP
ncbi:MAG: hypothetical protein KDA69_01350, partial [Planctomycetaceae bacterium]|nr:hypothetical protein [Planctomycetaceae bacterium]